MPTGFFMSKRVLALVLGLLFAALVTAAAFIASTYEDSARADEIIAKIIPKK